MSDKMNRIYELLGELDALMQDGIPILPGRIIVNQKELYKITHAFEETVPEEIQDARLIINKKDEIIQEAKLHAERIIQDAENERYNLLNESNLSKAMEEHAEKFRQSVFEECQQIKMQAFNEAQELRLNAKNEAINLKDNSQRYAQEVLVKLEQVLNSLYQDVMNNQQQLQEMKTSESMQKLGNE